MTLQGHIPFDRTNEAYDHIFDAAAVLGGLTLPALMEIRPALAPGGEAGGTLDAVIIQISLLCIALEALLEDGQTSGF